MWDPAGRYLYYLSDRDFAPQLFAGLEWNFAVNRTTGVYALALRKDVPHPLPPESDEVALEEEGADAAKGEAEKGEEKKEGETKDTAPEPVRIDFDGLAQRVTRLPIEADNLSGLTANEGHLFYTRSGAPYYGRESERKTALMVFEFEGRESEVLVDDIGGYTLSSKGSHVLVASNGGYARYDAKKGAAESKKEVSTGDLYVDRVPREEWDEVFRQVWRRFRDFFYVENMHGYDWAALRTQYEALLPHVAHRSDLNYVIGELIAELNVGHAYVAGGDWYTPERPSVALLGARFALDPATNRYRIAKILQGQNEEPRYRSPLTEIGVDVKEGEYLLAVDGVELTGAVDPFSVLRHRAGRPVELTVGATADLAAARKVKVNPITSETELHYLGFVLRNRQRVAELSGGRLAYVHIYGGFGGDGIRCLPSTTLHLIECEVRAGVAVQPPPGCLHESARPGHPHEPRHQRGPSVALRRIAVRSQHRDGGHRRHGRCGGHAAGMTSAARASSTASRTRAPDLFEVTELALEVAPPSGQDEPGVGDELAGPAVLRLAFALDRDGR